MELYKEILLHYLKNEDVQVFFPNMNVPVEKLVSFSCYQALNRIRDIIHDDTLTDRDCFLKIEEIITLFESIGSHGDNRHDF